MTAAAAAVAIAVGVGLVDIGAAVNSTHKAAAEKTLERWTMQGRRGQRDDTVVGFPPPRPPPPFPHADAVALRWGWDWG